MIKFEQYEFYRAPKYQQKLIEYLSEEEITKFEQLVYLIDKPGHKYAGYLFLLACYAGYRLSDCMNFDYEKSVSNGMIILRASKNKNIVSIPIHNKLIPVLEFLKTNKTTLVAEKIRQYVKELCRLVGINRNIKFHTSRHSFAMLLMKKGFTIDEVGHLIGDSSEVVKVYAKIHNESLNAKILDRLN